MKSERAVRRMLASRVNAGELRVWRNEEVSEGECSCIALVIPSAQIVLDRLCDAIEILPYQPGA